MPVDLKAHLLIAEKRRWVLVIVKFKGLEQRLLGLVAESKELAVQAPPGGPRRGGCGHAHGTGVLHRMAKTA